MADTSNLTNYLKDIAKAIKAKKGITEPILAANFDIEIETINVGGGTVENGDVKLFTSVEEMNNYIGANSGDLAVVYSTKAVAVASGIEFNNLYFPKSMSIPRRLFTQPTVTATGDANITVVFTSTSVKFSIEYPTCPYPFAVLYELSEGTTYVRNDAYPDNPFNAAELNEYGFIWSNELLTFPASVSVTFTMPVLGSDAVKAAFRYGELTFGGMYQYKSSKWTIADNQFSIKENDVISGKTAYGPDGLITGTRPVVTMELVEDVKYETITNHVGVVMNRDVAINTGGTLAVQGAVVADKVGLTGDKIVAGNTILGVTGTASAGVLSEEEYNNLLLLTDDILTNPNVDDNDTTEMFKLQPTTGPITEFAVSSEYALYGGNILFEEENAVRLEIIMEDEFQGRFLIYNDEYEHQPVTDSYAGVTASGIQVTGGHIADIDIQYYYFELDGLHVEFESASYHTFDNYLDIIDSIKIIPRNGVDNGDVATVSVEYTIGPISKLTVPQRYAESATSVAEESNMVKCSITTNNGWDGTFTVYDNTYELDHKANQDCGVTPSGVHVTGGTGVEDYPYYYWQVNDNVYVEFTTSEPDIFSNILDFVDSVEIIPTVYK